jgi:hypothetical protein
MGRLIASDGGLPKRLADYRAFCGYCLRQLEQTAGGATRCSNGCPP